jgi:hypothetical protein
MVTIVAAKPATSVIGQDVFPNTNNSVEVANISPTRNAIKARKCELALLEDDHLCGDERTNYFEATTEPENHANDSNLTEVAESVEGDAASGEQDATNSSQTNGHNYVALSVDSYVVTSESKAHSFETEGQQIDQQQKEARKTEADVLEGVLKPAERNYAGSVEELIREEVDADGHASVGGTADASGKQEAKPMQVEGEATSCILEFKEVDKDSEAVLCDDCTVPVLDMEDSELQYDGILRIPVMPSDGLPQVPGETEPSPSTNERNNDPYKSQLTILEEHYAVSKEGNINGILEQVHVPEITGRSGSEFHQRSASAADPPTIELVLENTHQCSSEDAEQKYNCGNSMSNEWQHHSFLQVRLDVLQHEYKVDLSHAFAMSVVRSFVREHEYWRFLNCPLCDRKNFVDIGLLLSHMCTRQTRAVLPRLEYSKLDYWLFHFVWLLLKFLADQGTKLFCVMVWDPGGIDDMYRLEGKPNFKKGGMSVVHHLNQEPWSPSRQGSWTATSKQPPKCRIPLCKGPTRQLPCERSGVDVAVARVCLGLCCVGSVMPCCCKGFMYRGVLLVNDIKQTSITISVDSSPCYLLPFPTSLLLQSLLLPLHSSR